MPEDVDQFAADYFRVGRALRDNAPAEERGWLEVLEESPSSLLDDLTMQKPDDAWLLMLALVERAPSEEDLAFLAAGPIEDLVRYHGRAFAGRMVVEARGNPRFRQALNYVWGWDELPGDVWVEMAPLLDPEVRTYWDGGRTARNHGRGGSDVTPQRRAKVPAKDRWRPPQARPRSERFT